MSYNIQKYKPIISSNKHNHDNYLTNKNTIIIIQRNTIYIYFNKQTYYQLKINHNHNTSYHLINTTIISSNQQKHI
jgi:hypothetical protein